MFILAIYAIGIPAVVLSVFVVILCVQAGLSLATLLPPISRFVMASWIHKIWLAVGFGFAATMVLYAFAIYALVELEVQTVEPTQAAKLGALKTELWLRTVVPPLFKEDCYSSQVAICRQADNIAFNFPRMSEDTDPIDLISLSDQDYQAIRAANDLSQRKIGWKDYLTAPGLISIPSLFGAAVGVFLFTTPPKKSKATP